MNKAEQNSLTKNLGERMNWWWTVLAGIWTITVWVLLLIDAGSESFDLRWFQRLYLAMTALMTPISYYTYWKDKRRAQKDEWRIPEKTLQLQSLFGGWPGSLIAQRKFRHKTRKVRFQMVFWTIVVLHLCVLVFIIIDRGGS